MGWEWLLYVAVVPVAAGLSLGVTGLLGWWFGWFGDVGPMRGRRHRRYLAGLAREATADADTCVALAALTPADRTWLEGAGWQEPRHAAFVRLNAWTP